MDVLTLLAVVALLAGVLVALTQKVWPVALLCLGLLFSVLADAGLIVR
ncbi:hypothetical protein MF672_018300 [Actinomadura sp. ATCC 31491]|uniref:Uncharacterized protein n=1 Tax=Actinomadura luzonensis TaxID=2805427 RepID=A0ABT0FUZ3_9ACTN|nr:hypothetical protein [Actinomadura luzonensis]MCK2215728.1 hypothetical protein [Actinomadura luzonensis]